MTKTIAITGADGFFGWHLRCHLLANAGDVDVVTIGRPDFNDPDVLADRCRGADAIVHLAGVNRGPESEVVAANPLLATRLCEALRRTSGAPTLVYANSIHSRRSTPYGQSKRGGSEILARWATEAGARFVDLLLPNLFGEHGRPNYNSAVATFCHDLAAGRPSNVNPSGQTELLHVQDACARVLQAIRDSRVQGKVLIEGEPVAIPGLYERLARFRESYEAAKVPSLPTRLDLRLFNTLRSALYPGFYPLVLQPHPDARGTFAELARGYGATQTSFSTTEPGMTRGEHFHFDKIERFVVVDGTAEIRLRQLFSAQIRTFKVDGSQPVAIDMPTLHAHSITNVGRRSLTTIFWANDHHDPSHPDTYAHAVDPLGEPAKC